MKLYLLAATGVLLATGCQQAFVAPAGAPERPLIVAPAEQSAPLITSAPVDPAPAMSVAPAVQAPELLPVALPPQSPVQPAAQPRPVVPAAVPLAGCSGGGRPPRECPPE